VEALSPTCIQVPVDGDTDPEGSARFSAEAFRVSDVRESVQKRVTQTRAKLRRLDEAFLYESSVDRTTYEEHRDRLREELTLTELELSEAQVEQFDIALAEDQYSLPTSCAANRGLN
jgi:hypothetical protein